MTIRFILIGIIAILLSTGLETPGRERLSDKCSWTCHNDHCIHSDLGPRAEQAYLGVIRTLHELGNYRRVNLLVYLLLYPVLAVLFGILLRTPWYWFVGTGVALAVLLAWPNTYEVCTDFCIHAGNLSGLGYAGFNFWLFLVALPGSLVLDAGLVGYRNSQKVQR